MQEEQFGIFKKIFFDTKLSSPRIRSVAADEHFADQKRCGTGGTVPVPVQGHYTAQGTAGGRKQQKLAKKFI